jgi:biotin carboxyl carrier protein
LLSALGIVWQRRAAEEAAQAGRVATVIRTAKAGPGVIERTLRLAGATGAENFVSLISPQLRGSRSDFGRGGKGGGGGDSVQAVQSTAGRGRSSGSAPSVDTGGSGGGSSIASTSSATSSGVSSSSFQAATSRSAQSSSISRGGGSSGSSSTPSASLGSDGLGSTGGSLGGGGGGDRGGGGGSPGGGGGGPGGGRGGGPGGGGGGSEFSLVLLDVAKSGSQVKKGDPVAEFDRQNMLLRLEDYRASIPQSEASLRKQKAQLEVTRKAHEQQVNAAQGGVEKAALDLKTTPVRSAIDTERMRLALEEAQARHKQLLDEVQFVEISENSAIRTAEIELQKTKVELQRSEANVDRMLTKAPIDGLVVMMQTFRSGEFGQIQKGDQVSAGQPFMQIVDLRSMVVNATVNQADVESLRIGQSARVRFDAYPELELPAKVFSIGAMTRPGGFRANYLKEIPIRLRLERMDPRVIPDLSVSADVIVEREDQAAAMAPLESVFQDAPGSAPYVFLRGSNGWRKREVQLGLASNTAVAIRSGIRPGDVIALARPGAETAPGDTGGSK